MSHLRLAQDPEPHSYNQDPLNQAAKRLLRRTREGAGAYDGAYLLQLMRWGIENRVAVPGLPELMFNELELAVGQLSGWKDPANVVLYLTNNPDGDESDVQRRELLTLLEDADTPEVAAGRALELLAARLQASGAPQWQHAASGLD